MCKEGRGGAFGAMNLSSFMSFIRSYVNSYKQTKQIIITELLTLHFFYV